ncbi:MAG: outer membrane protein transport protein [Pseudomonadota bacterium]|nr:outer membrane protein transport protein [Pseudomonadota bacterium]
MRIPFDRTRLTLAVAGAVLAVTCGTAQGAAFALQEQSGSGLGNAFAGGAAVAEDASTVWSNPAGMAYLTSAQIAAAAHLITPSIKFKNDGSAAAQFQPLGHTGGDAGSTVVVPNLYVAFPVNQQLAVGLGINAPFGLITEYGDGWIGRFQAIKSEVRTINVNPAISWRVSNNLSIGAGADFQRINATFTNRVNYSAALGQAAAQAAAAGQIPAAAIPGFLGAVTGLEAGAKIDGDDSAWGWNVGAILSLDPQSRLGAQYRSGFKYHVAGNVEFDRPSLPVLPATLAPIGAALSNGVNAALFNGGVRADIELPAIANLSYFRQLNDRWDVMADVQWTGWNKLKSLTFVRTTGATLGSTPENFKDAYRFAIGANYRYSDRWMFRGGIAYDESPVNDTDRTPRLPDNNRVWLSLGGQYKLSPQLKFDLGYTYINAEKANINQNAGSTAGSGLLKGSYDAHVNIVSGQVTYAF